VLLLPFLPNRPPREEERGGGERRGQQVLLLQERVVQQQVRGFFRPSDRYNRQQRRWSIERKVGTEEAAVRQIEAGVLCCARSRRVLHPPALLPSAVVGSARHIQRYAGGSSVTKQFAVRRHRQDTARARRAAARGAVVSAAMRRGERARQARGSGGCVRLARCSAVSARRRRRGRQAGGTGGVLLPREVA